MFSGSRSRACRLMSFRRITEWRLQPTSVSLGPTAGSSTAAGFSLYYCPSNEASCSTNNRNLMSQTIQPLNATDVYTYDKVNRVGLES